MDEREDLYSDWVLIETAGRYYLGRSVYDGASDGGNRPFNYVELEDAFEVMALRGQSMKDGTITISQQNIWMTLPLCMGGIPMELMWVNRVKLSKLSPVERAEYVKFIKSANENFQKNRAASVGLVVGNEKDLQTLGGRGRA